MSSQYMPYRPGNQLKATDINMLLAAVRFFTNSGNVGLGTNSVFIPPTNDHIWLNLTESIDKGNVDKDNVRCQGVLYGVPRKPPEKPEGGTPEDEDESTNVGSSTDGIWDFYEERPDSPHCQAFYTLSPILIPKEILDNEMPAEPEVPEGEDPPPELPEPEGESGEGGSSPTRSWYERVGDIMAGMQFVIAVPMYPGGRYLIDTENDPKEDSVSPGVLYVLDPKTNKLKEVPEEKHKSDLAILRRRYRPKTTKNSSGVDPRFFDTDDYVWCGAEGYYSGKRGDILDPPPGFELGPAYVVSYGGSYYYGKFHPELHSFWNVDTGFIVPGWVDRYTGQSMPHSAFMAQSGDSQQLLFGLEDDGGASDGEQIGTVPESITFGQGFAQYTEFQNTCSSEVIYNPVSSVGEPVVVEDSQVGVVRLPVSSQLLSSFSTPPRTDAPFKTSGGELQSMYEGGTYSPGVFDIANSFFVAKSMGLVEPAGSKASYQKAFYSYADTAGASSGLPFSGTVSVTVEGTDDPTDAQIKEALKTAYGYADVPLLETKIKLSETTLDQQTTYVYLCFGKYQPADAMASVEMRLAIGGASSSSSLYLQKTEPQLVVQGTGSSAVNTGYVKYQEFAVDDTISSTNGWIRYRYYDEIASNRSTETFELTPPSVVDGTGSKTWKIGETSVDPCLFTPFASAYGMGYGTIAVDSVDSTTKVATMTFTPHTASHTYDQFYSFPFMVPGLPPYKKTRVTTKTHKAHRADWKPALCGALDHNEVLVPGMLVEISETHTTISGSTFNYLTTSCPDSYSTYLEGTPIISTIKIDYYAPGECDLETGKIKEGDCWISGISTVSDSTTISTDPPIGVAYRHGISINTSADTGTTPGTPKIREPHGAFNDCENHGSLTLFLRTTAWGMKYMCSGRLDYIPFGYAVPSKTPSCYYRITGDNCAVHLVNQRYRIQRNEEDGRIYLTGACYVPCSSLTSLGSS